MAAKRVARAKRRNDCAFELLEPRLFLSTTMFREGGGTGYTAAAFDDTTLTGNSDANGSNWAIELASGTGSNYKAGLMALKDLFTLLPQAIDGGTINISSAKLHVFRYGGTSSDTIYIDRMTSNWLPDAAGSNDSDATFLHRDKSADLHWAGGGNFSSSDYTTTHEVSGPWVNNYNEEKVFDITAMMQDIYSTSTNYGFVIRTSNADTFNASEFSVVAARPILEITYTYDTTVSIVATDASATEPSDTGTYTVTRGGSTTNDLTVNYTVSGTATNGTDYTALSGTITIPSGQSSATITLTPTNDNTVESTETAILTLASGTGYSIGSPSGATVNITDNDSTVTISATDASAAEPSNTGTFTVTRSGYTGAALTVNFSKSGTAANGTDYNSIGTTVTIPSGQATTTITVTPIDDTTTESTETVILTLASGTDYTVGSPSAATVNIADNDSASFGITGVSGTVNARQTVTVSGTNFGSGPDAVVFDDFENGVADTRIRSNIGTPLVGDWNSTDGIVTYTDDYSISGDNAFKADMGSPAGANKLVRNFAAGTSELFATWWVRVPDVMPGDGNQYGVNWKHVWILGNTTGDDDILVVFLGTPAQILISGNCGTTTKYSSWTEGNGFERGDWLRMTFHVKGGTTDGSYKLSILNASTSASTTVTMAAGKTWGGTPTPTQYETINFNGYGRTTTGSYPMFDDTYSASGANARARIEIGNASTYSACTNLSVCPPTSWSSTSIDAKINFGSLNTSSQLYMYVIKADGTVSSGYPITVSQAPLANNDSYIVSTNGTLTASTPGVIANDIDLQGGTLTATKMSDPSHGSVSFNSNGSFTYTPTSNYYGADSFTYRLSDGTNTGNTATVNISVRQNLVNFGDSAANNTFGTAWTTVAKGTYLSYSAAGPAGLAGDSGPLAYRRIGGTARTFGTGEKIYITWYNSGTASYTFTPRISFDDPDQSNGGTSGTWYDLQPITLDPGQTFVTPYTIATSGSFSFVNVLTNLYNQNGLMLDKIEFD